jgi:diguanylate cyclase (GGDEF)-like protein
MDPRTVIIVLTLNLLSSGGLFYLIARKMPPRGGLGAFAAGASTFGAAYALRLFVGMDAPALLGGLADTAMILGALLFTAGVRQFVGHQVVAIRPKPILLLLLLYGACHTVAVMVWGEVGRHVLLNTALGLLYLMLAGVAAHGVGSAYAVLRTPLVLLVVLMGLLALMTLGRAALIAHYGAWAAFNGLPSQIYYAYASLAAVLLGPNLLWMVFVRLNQKLAELASRDALTRTLNRNGLDDALRRHFGARLQRPIVWLQVDIDHFKRINDSHGHAAGDAVLLAVAGVLTRLVRTDDFVARTGGEEFLVACVDASADTARMLGERLREGVSALRVAAPTGDALLTCTVSIGVSQPFSALAQWENAARAADRALYAAKAGGRDRVVLPD